MANEIRLRSNNMSGTITDNPLTNVATTINSASFVNLPTVTAVNHLILILDPLGTAGNPEIVTVTAHTAAASSVTVARGAEGSSARTHSLGTTWFHGPIVSDYNYTDIGALSTNRPANPTVGQMIYETDTDALSVRSAGPVWQNLISSLGAWTTWTPTLGQGATTNIAKTVTYAKYVKLGRLVIANFTLTVTGTGTATSGVSITLPVNMNATEAAVDFTMGTAYIFDTSANTYYGGMAKTAGSVSTITFLPLTSVGVGSQNLGIGNVVAVTTFGAALAAGDTVSGSLMYEAVS